MTTDTPNPLLRSRGQDNSGKVGMVELFFDLVFVFAVTQLSHGLLARLTIEGAAQTAVLLLAMWYVWVFTSWVTNWLDPDRIAVRVMLFAMMLAGLVFSIAIPKAFAGLGLTFAAAFVAMQVGRTLFFLWVVRTGPVYRRKNFERVLAWMLASGVIWIAGGLADPAARMSWWSAAVIVDFIGPWAYFWVPGLGRSTTADWDVDGSHMAERCGLFVIIALGESLLITGATFAERVATAGAIWGLVSAFAATVAMWWIYFHAGAEHAAQRIAQSDDPGRTARNAYSYLHILIVSGIIVGAVGDEIVLVHPEHADGAAIATVLGGPAIFIVGTAAFKWVSYDRKAPPLSHVAGLLLLALLSAGAHAHWFSTLRLGVAAAAVLMLVALWETLALRGNEAAGEPAG